MEAQKFMPLRILKEREKKDIESELDERFGIKEINGILLMKGNERMFFFSGNFDENKIKKLEEKVIIERVGFYFAKITD